jgi:hypothetical protein
VRWRSPLRAGVAARCGVPPGSGGPARGIPGPAGWNRGVTARALSQDHSRCGLRGFAWSEAAWVPAKAGWAQRCPRRQGEASSAQAPRSLRRRRLRQRSVAATATALRQSWGSWAPMNQRERIGQRAGKDRAFRPQRFPIRKLLETENAATSGKLQSETAWDEAGRH